MAQGTIEGSYRHRVDGKKVEDDLTDGVVTEDVGVVFEEAPESTKSRFAGVKEEMLVGEMEETDQPVVMDVEPGEDEHHAEVEFSAGETVKVQGYEFIRVDVKLRVRTKLDPAQIQAGFEFAKNWVNERRKEEVESLLEELRD